MFSASDLRKGLKIEIDGDPYVITEFTFTKPGKGQSIYRCKMRNMISGNTQERSYRSNDKLDKPDLMEKDMIFSYVDGDNYIFMDDVTYDQLDISSEVIGDMKYFLLEDMTCQVLLFNERALEVTLPNFVEKEIAETEPGARGDTATNVLKPAKLDNGYELGVPIFISEGDVIRIDTRTGEYGGRA